MSTGFPMAEPTALVSKEGKIPTIEKLLPPESMTHKVEATIPPVGLEVTTPTVATIELEGPPADSLRSRFSFHLFPQLQFVFGRDFLLSVSY